MADMYAEYLSLLDTLCGKLGELSELERRKTLVVKNNDLLGLDEVMKQEQAIAMAMRGYERKRVSLLEQMGMAGVPLTELAKHFPAGQRTQAQRAAEALRNQYGIYQTAAEVARNTLECSLHEIEKVLRAAGVADENGPGYSGQSDAEPPNSMKTDFRA